MRSRAPQQQSFDDHHMRSGRGGPRPGAVEGAGRCGDGVAFAFSPRLDRVLESARREKAKATPSPLDTPRPLPTLFGTESRPACARHRARRKPIRNPEAAPGSGLSGASGAARSAGPCAVPRPRRGGRSAARPRPGARPRRGPAGGRRAVPRAAQPARPDRSQRRRRAQRRSPRRRARPPSPTSRHRAGSCAISSCGVYTPSASTSCGSSPPRSKAAAYTSPRRASSSGTTVASLGSAAQARAARVGTGSSGRGVPNASPLAVASPTRRPVNDPGPIETAKAPTCDSSLPASESAVSTAGSRASAAVSSAAAVTSATSSSPRSSATLVVRVAVSSASTSGASAPAATARGPSGSNR